MLSKGTSKEQTSRRTKMFPKEKFVGQIGMVSKESDKCEGELYRILLYIIIVTSMR